MTLLNYALIINLLLLLFIIAVFVFFFCVFFDQAILTRKGTVYRAKTNEKKIALTFDDGPSPQWTPMILDELRKVDIKATFFMIGHHVKKYPDIARKVVDQGHSIGNHSYAHSVLLYYKPEEIEEEIKYTENVINEATGIKTKYFRPPKAWLRNVIKNKIKSMDYQLILWSLNSKDWVSFNHKLIVKYITKNVKNGDIILFHDSGNVLSTEGGDRSQTVMSIPLLAESLRKDGFKFVSLEELLNV